MIIFLVKKIKLVQKMAEGKTWEFDNTFIPQYVPNDLKWFERDELETWYRQNKRNEFLNDIDEHFKKLKIVNFDTINHDFSQNKMQQYQTIDDALKQCLPNHQETIQSSVFRNAKCKDMYVQKKNNTRTF